MKIRMKLTASLYISTLLYFVINSQSVTQDDCTDTLPTTWTASFCPEDITRIEYQIDMDTSQLTKDNTNTVDQIDLFLKWIVDNFEKNKYLGEFRLRTTKIEKYYRNVTQLKLKEDPHPTLTALKYRRTFGSFQNTDSYGKSSLKYQNDLTLEASMSGLPTFNYTPVTPTEQYSQVFEYKIEPNVFTDMCSATNWSNYSYGQKTGYSAKLQFDDDENIIADGTNGPIIVNTANWINISNLDAFFCDNCSSNSCVCCDIEQEFFINYCDYFNYSLVDVFGYSTFVDYVVDVDFYWYKNKDWGSVDATRYSEGKLTFMVKYADLEDKNMDIPEDGDAEFSVKLYKSETVDGEWANLILFAQDLVDDLVFPSDDIPSNEWFDYSECVPISTDEFIETLTNAQEVDEWFIVSLTFIVLFVVSALVLCYFIWIHCKRDEKETRGGYHKAEDEEIEAYAETIQEAAFQEAE